MNRIRMPRVLLRMVWWSVATMSAGGVASAGELLGADGLPLQGPALVRRILDDLGSTLPNAKMEALQAAAKLRGDDMRVALAPPFNLSFVLTEVARNPYEFDRLRAEALSTLIAMREQNSAGFDLVNVLLPLVHPTMDPNYRERGTTHDREVLRTQYNVQVGLVALDALRQMVDSGDVARLGRQRDVNDALFRLWGHREKVRARDPLYPPAQLTNRVLVLMGSMADAASPRFKRNVAIPFFKKNNKNRSDHQLMPGMLMALAQYFNRLPAENRAGYYQEFPKIAGDILKAYAVQPDTGTGFVPTDPEALDRVTKPAELTERERFEVRMAAISTLTVMAARNSKIFADRAADAGHSANIVRDFQNLKDILKTEFQQTRNDFETQAVARLFGYVQDEDIIRLLLKEAAPRTGDRPQMHFQALQTVNDVLIGSLRPIAEIVGELRAKASLTAAERKAMEQWQALYEDIRRHYSFLMLAAPTPAPFRIQAARYLGYWPTVLNRYGVIESLADATEYTFFLNALRQTAGGASASPEPAPAPEAVPAPGATAKSTASVLTARDERRLAAQFFEAAADYRYRLMLVKLQSPQGSTDESVVKSLGLDPNRDPTGLIAAGQAMQQALHQLASLYAKGGDGNARNYDVFTTPEQWASGGGRPDWRNYLIARIEAMGTLAREDAERPISIDAAAALEKGGAERAQRELAGMMAALPEVNASLRFLTGQEFQKIDPVTLEPTKEVDLLAWIAWWSIPENRQSFQPAPERGTR